MKKEKTYGKILIPPTKENVKKWLIERYGNDFEPNYLNKIIDEYITSTKNHTEYAKKLAVKYISENIFKLDRIYRKQESLYWVKRGWDKKTAENKRIIRNKNWYLNTYGDIDGLKKYNTKNENISKNSGHTLEKYIERYGKVEGPIKYDDYKKTCARNLQFFVEKYGEFEGKKRYKQFKKHIGKASKESMLVFKPLIKWLVNYIDISEIYYGDDNSREFFIVNDGKTYLYDFTIKNLNIIIEFNGVKFHVNEEWSVDKINNWKHPFKNTTPNEMINNDKFKHNLALKQGFEILTIWSDQPIEENIEKCKNFIKNKLNEK